MTNQPIEWILFVVFLLLKLTDVIDWSWWWITAPLWGPFALVIGVGLIVGVLSLIGCALSVDVPHSRR